MSASKKKLDISVLFRLLGVVKPWLVWLGICGVLMVLREGARIALFDQIGRLVDRAIGQNNSGTFTILAVAAGLILVISIIRGYAFFTSELLESVSFFSFSKKTVSRIIDLPLQFLERHNTGDLISRLNNDINKIDKFLGLRARSMYENLLKYVIAATYMLIVNWKMAIVCVLMGPIIMLSIRRLVGELRRLSEASNKMHGKETAYVSDTLQGIREVKAFNLIEHRIDGYDSITQDLLAFLKPLVRKEHLIRGICDILFFIPEIVIMGLGGFLVLRGELSVGQVLAFRFVYTAVRGGIDGFISALPMYKEAVTTGERIFEVIDEPTEEELHSTEKGLHSSDHGALLRLDHVSFTYKTGGDAASPEITPFSIKEITFSIMPGETVALVGRSGSGKSTILKLLAGFYEPDSGFLYSKDRRFDSLSLDTLREDMALVTQDPFLFPTTIHNNIVYGLGRGIRESNGQNQDIPIQPEIIQAARSADIHDFAMQCPLGYESLVGERGIKLSGGQKQRISIARAILKKPGLLLLDEPTSALDVEAEHRVQTALGRLMDGRSTIIAAHRLSSIKHVDRILVLDKGKIVEQGKHDDLMAQEGLYFDLYRLQTRDGGDR